MSIPLVGSEIPLVGSRRRTATAPGGGPGRPGLAGRGQPQAARRPALAACAARLRGPGGGARLAAGPVGGRRGGAARGGQPQAARRGRRWRARRRSSYVERSRARRGQPQAERRARANPRAQPPAPPLRATPPAWGVRDSRAAGDPPATDHHATTANPTRRARRRAGGPGRRAGAPARRGPGAAAARPTAANASRAGQGGEHPHTPAKGRQGRAGAGRVGFSDIFPFIPPPRMKIGFRA